MSFLGIEFVQVSFHPLGSVGHLNKHIIAPVFPVEAEEAGD